MMGADLMALLQEIDDEFEPSLSSRSNLAEYATKLMAHATDFAIYEEQRLSAFAAVYCNDPAGERAYLTLIAVAKSCRGRGLARTVLEMCLRYLQSRKFKVLELEVYKNNAAALAMYESFGFMRVRETETALLLAVSI
jgi:ribosomal protein S18 acetylase RimI-like enzyme